jgi:membrane protease subunit HflC
MSGCRDECFQFGGEKMKRKIIVVAVLAVVLTAAAFSLYIVNENEYVIVTQFGKPVRIVESPGLYFKLTGVLQQTNRFEKRTDVFETQPIQLLLADANPIILSCYITWRVTKPLTFFQSLGDVENAKVKLNDMVNSQLGIILGDYKLDNVINTSEAMVKLSEIENRLTSGTNKRMGEKYGIKIVEVGVNRIAYPSIVSDAVYERMKSERKKEADKLRAEGREEAAKIEAEVNKEAKDIQAEAYKNAEILKGEGDAEAMAIYAEAYGKDVEFFDFMESLDTYKNILENKSTLILSTDSELFKYLNIKDKTLGK